MVDFDRMMLSTTIDNCDNNSDQSRNRPKQTPSLSMTNAQVIK